MSTKANKRVSQQALRRLLQIFYLNKQNKYTRCLFLDVCKDGYREVKDEE